MLAPIVLPGIDGLTIPACPFNSRLPLAAHHATIGV